MINEIDTALSIAHTVLLFLDTTLLTATDILTSDMTELTEH